MPRAGEGVDPADFRAARERAGLSQQNVADALGVALKSVKRWENEASGMEAPDSARELLARALAGQREAAQAALETVRAQEDAYGGGPREVVLTYYRNQFMYDEHGREPGFFGQANANARAAAAVLEAAGYRVGFRYPGHGAIPCPGSRY